MLLEKGHAMVGKHMQRLKNADKKKRNPQICEIPVGHKIPRIPGNNKDAASYNYTEHFGETVKKQKIIKIYQGVTGEYQQAGGYV